MPFADDVRAGLSATPKRLQPKYFYDELGSHLFEAICATPEYYLTRTEAAILEAAANEIAERSLPSVILEFGSGSAVKTRRLLEATLSRGGELTYVPVDISRSALHATEAALRAEYPRLTVSGIEADYPEALARLAVRGAAGSGARSLVLFLGSNIGNFDPPAALEFLDAIRGVLAEGDTLLLGTDLKKDPHILEAAYNDALGITAAFNLNLLVRINRELGGQFDVRRFRHRAEYDEDRGCIDMYLESMIDQTVRIEGLPLDVTLATGETIHTESSYKFSLADVEHMASQTGFAVEKIWTDEREYFACTLLRAAPRATPPRAR
jgi:L-histidine N-alpha-methyltransferase